MDRSIMNLLERINKSADELPQVEVSIKQWGGKTTVRRLSLSERSNMFELLSGENNNTNVATLLVAFSLVDEDGEKLHKKAPVMEIYKSLENGDHEVVDLLFEEADKLSAITNKAIGKLEKN